MSDPKRKIAETLADERKPRSGTLFGMAKPMSDQERALRAKIAAGGETIYAPSRRAPLEGLLNMDPFEMVTGMPLTDGNEDYGKLTQTALGGAADYMTPAYLQPGYQGPQTGMGPVGDAMAGLGQVFQGGNVTGPMGAPSTVLSQYAGHLPAADRAFGTAGGVKVPGRSVFDRMSSMGGRQVAPVEMTAAEIEAEGRRFARQFQTVDKIDNYVETLKDHPTIQRMLPALQRAKEILAGSAQKKSEVAAPEGITAYHGSPRTFDKFDMSKIGTGEGAQAYGHGLYFAENEGVARGYQENLSGRSNDPHQYTAADYLRDAGGDRAKAIAELEARISERFGDKRPKIGELGFDTYRKLQDAHGLLKSGEDINLNEGALYQVRLNVKPDELLDWDRPLSQQSEFVRGKVTGILGRTPPVDHPGGTLYNRMSEEFGGARGAPPPEMTERLKAQGIKGIRYLDQGSRPIDDAFGPAAQAQAKVSLAKAIERGDTQQAAHLRKVIRNMEEGAARQKTYNYVIFDDKLVTILKRYGIPITLGAGGAAIVSGHDMPPEVAAQLGPQG